MKLKLAKSESISIKIPSESQSAYLQPRSPKLSQVKSVKSILHRQSYQIKPPQQKLSEIKSKDLKKNTRKHMYRGSVQDDSIEVKEMSQNVIVIEEERKDKKLQYQYQMLKILPQQISVYCSQLPLSSRINLKSVQQIHLFTNYIKSFNQLAFDKLTYLKYLDLNENIISQIPHNSINQHLISLQTLKLNSNQITTLPYLKHVKHLQLIDNPLKLITHKLTSMSLVTLNIDWMHYLTQGIPESTISQKSSLTDKYLKSKDNVQTKKTPQMTPLEVLKYKYVKKLNQKSQTLQEFYDFKSLFKLAIGKIPIMNLEERITELLSNTIQNQHFFIVQFLQKYFPNLQYNKMNLYNKFLLQDVLHVRNTHFSQYITKLFKPHKWPYQGVYPFIDNLYIAIKNSSLSFVQYLLQLEAAQKILKLKKQQIIQFLLTEFRETADGVYIAEAVCMKIFGKSDHENKKDAIEISLAKFPLSKSRVIVNFRNFIARNQKLKPFILFIRRSNYFQNSLLHFAMKSHEPQTAVELILQTQHKLDLFLKNSLGQTAKCEFAGDKLCKRMIWKLQKKYLKQHNRLKHDTQTEIRLLDLKVGKELEVAYVKMSRIRTKKLKEIIKLLDLDCPIMKGIMSNCLQNEYLQSEQQVYFLLQQMLEKLDKINSQLKSKHKSLSSNEFFVIILKLLQTQIYDKRSYLAGEIGKLITRKKQDIPLVSLQDINQKDALNDQLNFTDDELMIEYQLMHSIPMLKNQNLMVSSSANKTSQYQETYSSMGLFNLSRFSCKKCD